MLAARDLFRRILVISRPKSQRLWELLGKFRDRTGADGMITLQKEVQLRGVNFLRAADKQTMPYPDSSAVGGEAIDRLISAQEEGTVLILVDIPTERSGSKTSLEYLPEADRRDMLQEWKLPSILEDSIVWKTLHDSFLESVRKTRVFCHPEFRETFEAGIGKNDLAGC